jgi:hypothetical protein
MYTSSEDGCSLPSTIRFGPAGALLLSNMSDMKELQVLQTKCSPGLQGLL